MWQTVFGFTNIVALIGWAILLVAPRGPKSATLVMYGGVALLCLTYAAMIVTLHLGLADPARLPGTPPADIRDYSIAGLRNLFLSDAGLVMGWTHFLALDLFAGLWIAKDADHKGFSRLVQAPVLLLTLLAGPVGLLIWLAVRERRARAVAKGTGAGGTGARH